MPNFILTGTPGAGKTAVLRQLELNGHGVVEEAATDVIALDQALGESESWRQPGFVDRIVTLQRSRQLTAASRSRGTTFFDRSPVCTLALSRYLTLPATRRLLDEVDRLIAENLYEPAVFFIRNQGFVQATAARRITFEESLRFEEIHELTYRELGFELVEVPAAPLPIRAGIIEQELRRRS